LDVGIRPIFSRFADNSSLKFGNSLQEDCVRAGSLVDVRVPPFLTQGVQIAPKAIAIGAKMPLTMGGISFAAPQTRARIANIIPEILCMWHLDFPFWAKNSTTLDLPDPKVQSHDWRQRCVRVPAGALRPAAAYTGAKNAC